LSFFKKKGFWHGSVGNIVEVSFALLLLKLNFSMKLFEKLIKHGVSFWQRQSLSLFLLLLPQSLLCKHYKEVLMGLNSHFITHFFSLYISLLPLLQKKKGKRK